MSTSPTHEISRRVPDIFVSHDSKRGREAILCQQLVRKHTLKPAERGRELPHVFLSSDAHSIPSGKSWFDCILGGLGTCKAFCALIVDVADLENRWIPFEVSFVLGRGDIAVNVFVFGQIEMKKVPAPMSQLHLISTADTNRVWNAMTGMGVNETEESIKEFAHLFRQCGHHRDPEEPCIGIDLNR